MSEKAQRMSEKIQILKSNLRQFTRRPSVTMRDVINLARENLAAQMYGQMNQEASQHQTPAQGRSQQAQGSGRPTILGSLFGGSQQQQAPQEQPMSEAQIEFQRKEEIAYQRAREKALNEQKNLSRLKRQRGFSIVPE